MSGSKIALQARYPDRKFSGRVVGNYLEMVKTLVRPPDIVSESKKVSTPEPGSREMPVPLMWFLENKKKIILNAPVACNRDGVRLKCDLGPLKHVFDLVSFFGPRKYSENKEKSVDYFPVVVDGGVIMVHPVHKCTPATRDPDLTLWRGRLTWGIVGIHNWTMESSGGYWGSSRFCAHIRICKRGGVEKGKVIMFPEKWLDRLEVWLKTIGDYIFDRRLSANQT